MIPSPPLEAYRVAVPPQKVPPPVTLTDAGSWFTVKISELVEVPPEVVTDTVPVVPLPTVAFTVVAVVPVITAFVPPIVTMVAPDKSVPLMIRDEPTQPKVEPRLLITGIGAEKIVTV